MKRGFLILVTAGAALAGGCASRAKAPVAGQAQALETRSTAKERDFAVVGDGRASGGGYDDRQISRLKRGETREPELLQWFGAPENRAVQADGRANLSWALSPRTDGGPGGCGVLRVVLGPDGKVDAYTARGGPLSETRTDEFVEKSEADLRERMEQWRREGWNVLSVSGRLPQADGTTHRKVELSRSLGGTASAAGYDDQLIASIRRGETAEAQLLEWFGPPHSREMRPDGRAQLAWSFASREGRGAGHEGALDVRLRPDGTVDSYAASRPAQ